MAIITQDMRFRLSLIHYAEKYGVSKAAIKYKTNQQYIYRWKRRFDGSIESLRDFPADLTTTLNSIPLMRLSLFPICADVTPMQVLLFSGLNSCSVVIPAPLLDSTASSKNRALWRFIRPIQSISQSLTSRWIILDSAFRWI